MFYKSVAQTQNEFLFDLLLSGKSITQKEGWEKYGICRVQARIHELERIKGLKINHSWKKVKTRYGDGETRVMEYSLFHEPKNEK
jgi:hypothetical protein